LTIGFQGEGAKDLAMAGAGFNAKLWRLGTFGAEGLASQTADKEQGYAATGVYSFLSNWFNTEMRATWIGPKFQNLFLTPADQEQVTADASATVSLGRLGSLTVGGTLGGPDALKARISQIDPDLLGRLPDSVKRNLQDALATQHDKLLRLSYTLNVTSRAQLSLNATRLEKTGSPIAWEGFASLTFALGWRTVASAVTTVDQDGEACGGGGGGGGRGRGGGGGGGNSKQAIRIEMAQGSSSSFAVRTMVGPGFATLEYNIYLDATHGTVWGTGEGTTQYYYDANPPNRTPVIVPAYGRIPGRQDVEAGSYHDNVPVRILF
jgi:hypothetical protein